jgi:V/A-type H+-transporting ATPase subunit K
MRLSFTSSKTWSMVIIMLTIMTSCMVVTLFTGKAYSTEAITQESKNPESTKWGFISAALATGLSTIAAAVAVGLVGSSAMGAMSERPEVAGRALIFVGLAEGIAIYGLIIAIMILGKV